MSANRLNGASLNGDVQTHGHVVREYSNPGHVTQPLKEGMTMKMNWTVTMIFAAMLTLVGCGVPPVGDDSGMNNNPDSGMMMVNDSGAQPDRVVPDVPAQATCEPGVPCQQQPVGNCRCLAVPCDDNSQCLSTLCAPDPDPRRNGLMVCNVVMPNTTCPNNREMCPSRDCLGGMCMASEGSQRCLAGDHCLTRSCDRPNIEREGACN